MINIFLEEIQPKPLTLKRKLLIWAMIFTFTPAFSYLYGYSERVNARYAEIERINSQPADVALPAELPTNIYDF